MEVEVLQAYGSLLSTLSSFQYLGWVLKVENDEWAAVIFNLIKARKWWAQMLQILVREGSNTWLFGLFYKAFVTSHTAIRVGDVGPGAPDGPYPWVIPR